MHSIYDNHGTSVAGIAAAAGDNDLGVTGVAFGAEFAALRILDHNFDFQDSIIANALSYQNQEIDIYNNSWGPYLPLLRPGPLTQAALENGVSQGRGGLGSIFVWAAGNKKTDNVNYNGYANSRYTIAVAQLNKTGQEVRSYEPGAPILVSAPTQGFTSNITTTNSSRFNLYTDTFSGTSAAAPMVSGVIALMLEANPTLTWRDVQHILVETAQQNDVLDEDWVLNGAGHHVNHKFGFGAVDATAAVNAALPWDSISPEVEVSSGLLSIDQVIPDNNIAGISSTFTVTEDLNLEWVEVTFDADHSYRGDLEITLTSPDGTESILAERHSDYRDDYDSWTFTSARHWGESSLGDWTLNVSDLDSIIEGTWNSWKLNLIGTDFSGAISGSSWIYDTSTGNVSTFDISLGAGQARSSLIGRNIQDKNWELQTTGDLNGDDQPDIILRNAAVGQNLVCYMAPGGQSIQSEAVIGRDIPDANWDIGGTGDLNGDGKTDLILRNQATDQFVVWYMDGNGGIQSEALVGRTLGDNNWQIAATADFNNDGRTDIVLRNNLSGDSILWEMDGGSILAESLMGLEIADPNWHIEGAADFDNDGTVDLFLRHQGVGQGLVWSMADKNTIASEQLIANVPTGSSQLVF